jgi:pyrroline-5-carboxylate reductase
MGEAIIAGLIRSGELRAERSPSSRLPARREQLRVTYPQLVLGDVPTAAPTVIAVKPDDVAAAVSEAVAAGVDTVLSVAAGVPLGRLEVAAGPGVAVVRAMPNTPALVGAGVAALAPGSEADETVLVWADPQRSETWCG